jgi:protein-tyrosine phosphatase
MRQIGERHGYTFDHRARQFSSKDFARFDLIAVMDQENYYDVARQASSQADLDKIIRMSDYLRHHPNQKTVPDPYYGDTRDFEFAIELLEDACEGLLLSISNDQKCQKK